MSRHRLFVVDVFAEEKYAGNQLAVVTGGAALTAETMQRIARETNYSETTFLMADRPRDGGYDVRIFTPQEELPFAGHPTLGTAWVIRHELAPVPTETVVLHLGVGSIPVRFEGPEPAAMGWMHQRSPEFLGAVSREEMARVLGIEPSEVDSRHPVEEVSTGLPCFIVPLRSLASVKRCRVDEARYDELIRRRESRNILLFSPETYHPANHLNVRVLADYFGVPEDPATGSANGCLAAWLMKHRYLGHGPVEARVEQGYEIGRPSLLHLRCRDDRGGLEVFVGGQVFLSIRGELA